MRRDAYNQVAGSVPFDNGTNGFTSEDVQAAIEEAYALGANASRGPTVCGFDGNASSGRWLEFYANNPSNNNPFIVAEPAELLALSIVTSSATATCTVSIFRNGVPIQTISLSSQKKNALNGLSHLLNTLDEVSVQVTAGTISRPTVFIFIRTLPV